MVFCYDSSSKLIHHLFLFLIKMTYTNPTKIVSSLGSKPCPLNVLIHISLLGLTLLFRSGDNGLQALNFLFRYHLSSIATLLS